MQRRVVLNGNSCGRKATCQVLVPAFTLERPLPMPYAASCEFSWTRYARLPPAVLSVIVVSRGCYGFPALDNDGVGYISMFC
jgi:hypothetical protein